MYDELVKRLRMRANLFKQINQMENCIMDEAADAIEKLSKPKWIPVTERLPENDGKFIALAYGEANTMDYYYGHWMYIGTEYTRVVTHWMPLPEPPQEE